MNEQDTGRGHADVVGDPKESVGIGAEPRRTTSISIAAPRGVRRGNRTTTTLRKLQSGRGGHDGPLASCSRAQGKETLPFGMSLVLEPTRVNCPTPVLA